MRRVVAGVAMVCMLVFGVVGFSVSKDSATDAEGLVKKAIAAYKGQGKEKAFAEIDDPNGRFKKGDLYVFVYDMAGTAVARPVTKGLIGKNIIESKDPDGKFYVKERIDLVKTKGKGWQDYKFLNPTTNKYEDKTAYVEGYDGYVFGCGIYK
ncbi:MAG TPA: cache domain-containing protein [Syntrophorhabdaceae bacterium]|nr:cache domain-containing protein [Syntrophorhabdaceae bacterium]